MQEQRVAIGRGLRDLVGADRAAAAAGVLDHDGLAEGFADLLREDARKQIGGAAGRKRTTQVMVREGNLSCAKTAGANSADAPAASALRRVTCLMVSPPYCFQRH